MAGNLTCEIVTPERKVYSSEASFVAAPASDGEIGILPMHVPLVCTLGSGEVRVTVDGGSIDRFAISGGYVQIQDGKKVIILANRATNLAEMDLEVAKGDVGELAMKIDHLEEGATNREFLEDELEWAKTQVRLAEK